MNETTRSQRTHVSLCVPLRVQLVEGPRVGAVGVTVHAATFQLKQQRMTSEL